MSGDKMPVSGDKKAKSGDKMPVSGDKTLISDVKNLTDIIMSYIEENGSITNSQAQVLLGLKTTRVREIQKDLTEKKVLDMKGTNKGTRYIKHGDEIDKSKEMG